MLCEYLVVGWQRFRLQKNPGLADRDEMGGVVYGNQDKAAVSISSVWQCLFAGRGGSLASPMMDAGVPRQDSAKRTVMGNFLPALTSRLAPQYFIAVRLPGAGAGGGR